MSATVPVATYQHLTWTETMLGMPIGPPTSHPVGPSGAARDVLEGTLRQSLQRDRQNYVLFSGGRDSSALLALAVHVARREGLPEPLPVIVRHPDSPESDEREWQDLVLDHLDVPDHVVIEMRGDQGLLAEVARGAIRRRGPMWPAAIQGHGAIYRHLEPGVIISGEGGDMVLTGHRPNIVRTMLSRPDRRTLRNGLKALRPASLTRRHAREDIARGKMPSPGWLREPGRLAYAEALSALLASPLRWDAATRHAGLNRSVCLGMANFEAEVAAHGSVSVNPLADAAFVDTLARDGGMLGWGDRTAIFRRLFGDLLPDEVLARGTKAAFNSTRWGEQERQFAHEWDGHGFDDDWIDAEALRSEWLSDRPHPISSFLLQVAWAISQGIPVTGDQP
ncbi:MAG TPA: asparagine synthase C-terminal domain-containing protein [Ruania sp.]|nr:asparagine synthase C-terminal domain-containing protein [Ruania sp.]